VVSVSHVESGEVLCAFEAFSTVVISWSEDLFSSAMVALLTGLMSMHHRFDLSDFGTNSAPTADSDLVTRIPHLISFYCVGGPFSTILLPDRSLREI
jgi:hypothetical protein